MKEKKRKQKRAFVELTLWDVILSYPNLHNPKPFKGKVYYSTDVLIDEDHPQLADLRSALKQVKSQVWGPDKSEWPTDTRYNPGIEDGNARSDSKGYAGRKYIRTKTQQSVPVIGPSGKEFNPQMVKGGMFANVAISVSAWENEGDEGVSIYLQGIQIDTRKTPLNFGGGKSVAQMFKKDGQDEDTDTDQNDDDEDDEPRGKKEKHARSSDDEDSGDSHGSDDTDSDGEEDSSPVKKSKKKASKNFDEDDED
jgi:Protein of unknown function (DUF2815)